MAGIRKNRVQAGSPSWILQERSCALQIAQAEAEEFTFSVCNEVDWLNEHMAEIFNANEVSVAEFFKTPGKLRGRTPMTVRKVHLLNHRPPLSSIFSTTSNSRISPSKHVSFEKPAPAFQITKDNLAQDESVGQSNLCLESSSFSKTVNKSSDPIPQDGVQKRNSIEQVSGISPIRSPSFLRINLEESNEFSKPNNENKATPKISPLQSENNSKSSRSPAGPKTQLNYVSDAFSNDNPQKNCLTLDDKSLYPSLRLSKSPEIDVFSSPKNSPANPSPQHQSSLQTTESCQRDHTKSQVAEPAENNSGELNFLSDGSSPIRPIVRKSSLNFASLPAREPITKKSIGNRTSRTSQLEQSRASYFGRQTGGISLEGITSRPDNDKNEIGQLDLVDTACEKEDSHILLLHNKTSTQRLQDQISRLGRPPKMRRSLNANINIAQAQVGKPSKPTKPSHLCEDDQVSVDHNPNRISNNAPIELEKSHSCALEINDTSLTNISQSDISNEHLIEVKNCDGNQARVSSENNEQRKSTSHKLPINPGNSSLEQDVNCSNHHLNPVTNPSFSASRNTENLMLQNLETNMSNSSTSLESPQFNTSPKSSQKSNRDSPLKVAKDKFSSILKSSKILFASTIATHIEEKTCTNPSYVMQMELKSCNSIEECTSNSLEKHEAPQVVSIGNDKNLNSHQATENSPKIIRSHSDSSDEERMKAGEFQATRLFAKSKMPEKSGNHLDQPHMKVNERVHLHHIEKEQLTSLQVHSGSCRPQDSQSNTAQNISKISSRVSPRKVKPHVESGKITATNASVSEPPGSDMESLDTRYRMTPSAMVSKSQIGRSAKKKPLRPTRTTQKNKPPTVIRVDTGSQRGQQCLLTNPSQSATFQESLSYQNSAPSHCLTHKSSVSSVQSKSSSSSYKSAATKTLEAAARKKEKDEIAALQKREAKLEIQRQRAKNKADEQKRRQEFENQLENQRERDKEIQISETKKMTSRQAIEKRRLELEKSKEARVAQQNLRKKVIDESEKAFSMASRTETSSSKAQQDSLRTVCSTLNNGNKFPPKRLFQHDNEEHHPRTTLQRNGPAHQHHEQQLKRRKTEESENQLDAGDDRPKITAPPIRQSGIRHKEMPTKSGFPSNYGNNFPSSSLQRSTLISQHTLNQSRGGHPMDMAQLVKGPIPFAQISSQGSSQNYKNTVNPAAPNSVAKSNIKSVSKTANKSSPRYQNGENIDLPDIPTDSEDENSEQETVRIRPGWTDTPEIHRQLAYQENIDPAEVFGQPGPLNMEEVFSKSKDRFHKFRARTSSANWSGNDRLTEEEIKRDLEGRDRVRRQGGWTYDAMV